MVYWGFICLSEFFFRVDGMDSGISPRSSTGVTWIPFFNIDNSTPYLLVSLFLFLPISLVLYTRQHMSFHRYVSKFRTFLEGLDPA